QALELACMTGVGEQMNDIATAKKCRERGQRAVLRLRRTLRPGMQQIMGSLGQRVVPEQDRGELELVDEQTAPPGSAIAHCSLDHVAGMRRSNRGVRAELHDLAGLPLHRRSISCIDGLRIELVDCCAESAQRRNLLAGA